MLGSDIRTRKHIHPLFICLILICTIVQTIISYLCTFINFIFVNDVTEYAYTSKATTKCDVYSFGVVLMELITGRKPVEAEFGENKNIRHWVSTKVETKEGVFEVLDKRLPGLFKDEMIKVLKIAIRCTYKTPSHRPTMSEVVQLLIEADPYGCDICKSSNKTEESANVTRTHSKNDE